MRKAGNVARMENIRNTYKILVGNLNRRNHLGDLIVDGRIILNSLYFNVYRG
jgi:hypothetical protein